MSVISHAAIWVSDLEKMRAFYERYFGAEPSAKYVNSIKRFESYFLGFESGARLELMRQDGRAMGGDCAGKGHLAFSVGEEAAVDALTETLARDGITVLSQARRTGDGYYESVISDPEGNLVEITV